MTTPGRAAADGRRHWATRRLAVSAALLFALAGAIVVAAPAGAQCDVPVDYQLPGSCPDPPPPPPPRVAPPWITPRPSIIFRGDQNARGARFSRVSVKAPVGTTVIYSCAPKKRCAEKKLMITGTRGTSRTIRIRRFERFMRAGVTLRVFAMSDGRTGRYKSVKIIADEELEIVGGCVWNLNRTPEFCPAF